MLEKIKLRLYFLNRKSYCPCCGEYLDDGPFCSKHGDVTGLPTYQYTIWYRLFQTAKQLLTR